MSQTVQSKICDPTEIRKRLSGLSQAEAMNLLIGQPRILYIYMYMSMRIPLRVPNLRTLNSKAVWTDCKIWRNYEDCNWIEEKKKQSTWDYLTALSGWIPIGFGQDVGSDRCFYGKHRSTSNPHLWDCRSFSEGARVSSNSRYFCVSNMRFR